MAKLPKYKADRPMAESMAQDFNLDMLRQIAAGAFDRAGALRSHGNMYADDFSRMAVSISAICNLAKGA